VSSRLYQSYGRTIESEVELDLPPAGDDALPPSFHLSSDTAERPEQTAGYRLLDLAELTFHEGRRVHLRQLTTMEAPILQHLLVDVAVPTALTAWDQPVLHASAIDDGAGAMLFTGPSGSGKSTLAIAGAARGAQLVADDGVLVDASSQVGVGSITTLRLHEEHASTVLPSVQAGEVVTLTGKRRIDADAEGITLASGPRPVLALFAIDRPGAEGVQVEACGPAEATDIVARSFFAPPGSPASAIRYLDLASSIASWLPVMRLEYPRDASRIDEVLAAAREAVRRASRSTVSQR
jgi:hypothetical protein